jgi:hypothetical protein
MAHTRSNRQAEHANTEVLRGLKTKTFDQLKGSGKGWFEEVPTVLWSLWTTPNRATGETPFSIVYGTEAVLPTELKYGSPQVCTYGEDAQHVARVDDVNFLKETRSWVAVRSARYEQGLHHYHIRRVWPRELEAGDLILRRIQNAKGMNKLSLQSGKALTR